MCALEQSGKEWLVFMKMTKEVVDTRRKKIMQEIQVKGTVNVDDLASELNVTPLTIRRDLQYWEDMGAVERFYHQYSPL